MQDIIIIDIVGLATLVEGAGYQIFSSMIFKLYFISNGVKQAVKLVFYLKNEYISASSIDSCENKIEFTLNCSEIGLLKN